MKAELRIDDDLFDAYKQEAFQRRIPIGDVLRERLTRALPLDPRNRGFIIGDPAIVQHLESILGGGHLTNEHDLSSRVTRLAAIRFGEHRIPITPAQFAELRFRATKTGRTVEQLIEAIAQKVANDFFTHYVP